MTQYFYTRDGQPEQVDFERWRWEAVYIDGSILKQFDKISDEHGEFHQFAEIDQSRLHVFRMVHENGRVISLLFDAEKNRQGKMKLIHFYRNYGRVVQVIEKNKIKDRDHLRLRGYVFGYESDTHKKFIVILPSDEAVITDNPDLVQPAIHTQEVA